MTFPDDLFQSACTRYLRDCERSGAIADQPTEVDSEWDGELLVLANRHRTLALYRVRDGKAGRYRFAACE